MLKRILAAVVLVSVLVSGLVLADRYKAEKRNSNVEIVVDMSDFQNLAADAEITFEEMAQDLKAHGATSIAVQEATLSNLKDRGLISYMTLGELFSTPYSKVAETPAAAEITALYQGNLNSDIISNSSVILTRDKKVYDFLYGALQKRGKTQQFQRAGTYAIVIGKKIKSIEQLGLGFFEEDLKYAKDLNFFSLIARVQNVIGIDEKSIDEKIKQIKDYKVATVVFAGDTVLGYNAAQAENQDILKYAARKFSEAGLISAIIEKPADENVEKVQRGITTFARASDYATTKVLSIDMDSKRSDDPKGIVDQWSRAIAERNVRILYVRPYVSSYKTPEENLQVSLWTLTAITERIKDMGLRRDAVKGLGNIFPKPYERFIIFAGIFAGAVLLLLCFIELNRVLASIIVGAGILGLGGAFILNQFVSILNTTLGDLLIKVAAFAAAVIFPSLAAVYIIDQHSKLSRQEKKPKLQYIILKSVGVLVTAVLISLIGGIMVSALLAESKYMLKLDIFRGVKLTFALPLLAYMALYITKVGVYLDKDGKPINVSLQIKKLLNTSVTVKYVAAGAVLLAGVAYLLARSGNAPAGYTSGVELQFRAYLENLLIARPRSKELLAFPLLMLLVYASINKYKIASFFIMFAGIIGIADIVNTFSHIRMPLKMAALSSIYSLVFGIITGIILIILWYIIEKRCCKNGNGRRETY